MITWFKYGDNITSNALVETINPDAITFADKTQISAGDFDGDGLSDFLVYEYEYDLNNEVYNTNLKIKKRSATTSTYTTVESRPFSGTGIRVENALKKSYYTQRKVVPQFSDFNGDGRDDIIISNFNTSAIIGGGYVNTLDYIHIFYTNSDGSLPTTPNFIYTPPSVSSAIIKGNEKQENYLQVGDFDGDGSADLFTMLGGDLKFHSPRKSITNKSIAQINLSTGPFPSSASKFDFLFREADEIFVVNMDGDSKSELMVVTNDVTRIFTFDFEASVYDLHLNQIGIDLGYPTTWHDIHFGDFNGDGKTDILTGPKRLLLTDTKDWTIGYFNGKEFVTKGFSFDAIIKNYEQHDEEFDDWQNLNKIVIGDFNGDGKSDILNVDVQFTSRYCYYFSNGDGFQFQPVYNTSFYPCISDFFAVGDFNGDSKSEILFRQDGVLPSYSQKMILSFNPDSKSHLLDKVKDGFNRTTEFTYEPLTKGTGTGSGDFYLKGTGKTWPLNNAQYPIYVTTSMKSPDGIGGINTTFFSYENLLVHRAGKGVLGFEKVRSRNSNSNIKTESIFDINTDFYIPYLKTSKTFLYSSGAQLSQVDNTVAFNMNITGAGVLRAGGAHDFVQKLTKTTESDLLKGVTTVTDYTYDGYTLGDGNGNILSTVSTTSGGGLTVSSTSIATYINTGGSTFPNRPSEIKTTVQRGLQPSVTTINRFNYCSNGLIQDKTSVPDGMGYVSFLTNKDSYVYDIFGNITKKTNSSFVTSYAPYTNYSYDSKGRFLVYEENMFGHKKEYTHHKFWGKSLSVKDFNGLTTNYSYNPWGKLTATIIPTSPSTSYTINYSDGWDIGTNQLFYSLTEDPSAPDVKQWFDYFGRTIKTRRQTFGGNWSTSTTSYNAKGGVQSETNFYLDSESPRTTTYTYDAFNRITSGTGVEGTTAYAYSEGGGFSTTTISLPDGKIKSSTYDASGKLFESKNGIAGTSVFEYDSRGNETRIGMRGNFGGILSYPITKEYNELGQIKKLIDLDAGTTKYNYNPQGQLLSQTDPDGNTTSFTYDATGRVIQKICPPILQLILILARITITGWLRLKW